MKTFRPLNYDNHLLRLASFNAHFTLLCEQKLVVTEEVFSLKVLSVWKFHSYCQRKYQTELENETREKRRESCPLSRVQLILNIVNNSLTQIQPLKILIVMQARMISIRGSKISIRRCIPFFVNL